MNMKTLNQYIKEKLIINKDYRDNKIVVKSFDELRKIIVDRYYKLGPGTKQNPIDFNDIDVSNLNSFCNNEYPRIFETGIFESIKFKYIDISYWDVSNVKSMCQMFHCCKELESVGDISKWDVSNVTDMSSMFYNCKALKTVGDISGWNVSNVTHMSRMFYWCKALKTVGDISGWDVSKVKFKIYIFLNCPIKEEYKPKFK